MNGEPPTAAEPAGGGTYSDGFDLALPDFAVPDDAAIHRAIRRGVLRAGFAAASWLLLATVLLVIAVAGTTALRTRGFEHVTYRGVQAAHPEYEFTGMRCCGGIATVQIAVELSVRGEIGGSGTRTGSVHKPLFGGVEVRLGDESATPVRRALARGPVAKADTRAFLDKLPAGVAASAIVEFVTPLDAAAFDNFTVQDPPTGGYGAVFLTGPYAPGPVVSWPSPHDLAGFARWAGSLRAGDDGLLATLDLPPSSTLRALAREASVRAVVVDRASVAQLRALLDNPAVRGVNLADINFDTSAQLHN